MNWDNMTVPQNVVHIQGTTDKLLPYLYVKPNDTVIGGEQLMRMDMASNITTLIKKILSD